MAYDRFLIAPINGGLQTDLKPWLIPDDAFAQLNNAYVFRARVRKRFGATLTGSGWPSAAMAPFYSRLRIQVGTVNTPISPVPGIIREVGQMFSIGTQVFTVISDTTGAQQMMHTDADTGTFDVSNGNFAFTSAQPGTTPIYFYPAQPVMGLTQYEVGAVNNHPSYAFDTQFAYVFAGGFWSRSGSVVWHGTDANFFWATNWFGLTDNIVVLFVSNFYVVNANGLVDASDDPMYRFDGTTWNAFSPKFLVAGAGNFVKTARIIVAFKNRLVLLNTIETDAANANNISYPNRCRFSQNGSPINANAFLEQNQVGALGGGFIDATTEEGITGCDFIKDRLIVYFERSTWELVYTGNEIQPFNWQKINTELGSESTFSTVPFDKIVMAIGETGVHACNGANVDRIDDKVPDQVFQIRNRNQGVARVAGIRDYYTEMVYWTYPSDNAATTSDTYPNQVFVYNYKTGSWAFNDDCITCFGYLEQQTATTWASTTSTWANSNFTWNSGVIQANFRQVIAGNQQGFVFIIDPDVSRNAPVMYITNMTTTFAPIITMINHTLATGDFIAIENAQGTTGMNGKIFEILGVIDSDNVLIGPNLDGGGTYTGGGVATRVSRIDIRSKQWNPYVDKGRNVYLAKITFGVEKTSNGEISVDYFPSSTDLSLVNDGIANGTILGTAVLETRPYASVPLEIQQTRLWHPVYFQAEGECVQIRLWLDQSQMLDPGIAWENFELEGLVLYTSPTSLRLE